MIRALIGHTGFVGAMLLANGDFAGTYNSTNIEDLAGKRYERSSAPGSPR